MFSLIPINQEDFEFRWEVYALTIKSYIDTFLDWDEAHHREMIRSNLIEGGNHAAILVNGTRVGIAQIEETADLLSLLQIEILPEYQGVGIGSAVSGSLMQRAHSTAKTMELNVFLSNSGALRLYERLGFVAVDTSDRDVKMRYVPPPTDLRRAEP